MFIVDMDNFVITKNCTILENIGIVAMKKVMPIKKKMVDKYVMCGGIPATRKTGIFISLVVVIQCVLTSYFFFTRHIFF